MAALDDLRRFALELPGAYEDLHMGGPAFRVDGHKFGLWWVPDERAILKLDPAHQLMLFEVRPETFQPLRVGVGTWSYVELGDVDLDELQALVREAWSTVVPKRISRPLLALAHLA